MWRRMKTRIEYRQTGGNADDNIVSEWVEFNAPPDTMKVISGRVGCVQNILPCHPLAGSHRSNTKRTNERFHRSHALLPPVLLLTNRDTSTPSSNSPAANCALVGLAGCIVQSVVDRPLPSPSVRRDVSTAVERYCWQRKSESTKRRSVAPSCDRRPQHSHNWMIEQSQGIAEWLRRRSLAGGLSMNSASCAMVNRWSLCG